jgi:Zn-dependent peptidase ImmA (M78 family)
MLNNYISTPLEQWIEALYEKLEITAPEQLQIAELAGKLNIWVYFMDMGSMTIEKQGVFSVNIDRRLSGNEQWEDFLHELCHVLRHSGNQLVMPTPYMDWQEQDAAHFQLYAAIPMFMVRRLKLPEHQSEMIELLAEEFHVTHRLAAVRLEQIQRRVLQGLLDQEYRSHLVQQVYPAHDANWSEGTRVIMNKLQQQIEKKGNSNYG